MSQQRDNNSAGRQVVALVDETTPGPRFSRFRKVLLFGVAGLIVVALCVGLAVLHSRAEKRRAWAEIQKRLEAIRAAGEPVTADDLAKLYPDPPPERDAALLLAPAVAALGKLNSTIELPFFGNGELPPRTQAFSEQMRTNMEAILNDNQTALDAVPWDKMTNAWFGSSFTLGFTNMENPQLYGVNRLTRLLALKAIVEADSGDGKKAMESIQRALALSGTLRNDTRLHLLTSRTGEKRVCEAVERVINRAEIPADALAALEQMLADDHTDGLREAFLSLRCLNIFSMNAVRVAPDSSFYYAPPSEGKLETAVKSEFYGTALRLSGKIYADTDFSEMLDVRSAQIVALKSPPKERFAEFTRLNIKFADEGRPTFAAGVFGAALGLSKQVRSDAEVLATLQVTRVALEVERWRLAHGGRAPDSLAELVPDFAPSIPLDPFDNNPLRYKKLARGFLVYSIGADFTDDGGKEKTGGVADSDHYDITFRVER